ncbi:MULTISPECIES: class I SAM-dependent DNA methyltransferase [Rhodopirellula]|uniref:class I SAM-dependent DNA methyltransferase n=1 Tax=Rhodopirellula TaxID=265488 RepID=UPI0030EE3E63
MLRDFHGELCETRVLDPACGSGNFLYVAMELMKKLEGEVVNALSGFDDDVLPGVTIDPHQFLGIEVNPRAAALAELVLWIGFIQWHRRTRDELTPPIPILKDYKNIECRDAVLDWDSIENALDADGQPITRWDGRTTKRHPVTGEQIPDESARTEELRYVNPRKVSWPETEFIVGNPPFIGGWKLRQDLGNGYTDALWSAYNDIPNKADYVMYWWDCAAQLVGSGRVRQCGFITTNSLRQTFNRKVVDANLSRVSIVFAVPDHPWVDSTRGADVRISMTVVAKGDLDGRLHVIVPEKRNVHAVRGDTFRTSVGEILGSLTVGADIGSAVPLQSMSNICFAGIKLHGKGFVLQPNELLDFAGEEAVVKRYIGGRDLVQQNRGLSVIDFFGVEFERLAEDFPKSFQRILTLVKPERDQNRDKSIRDNWWLPGRWRPELRDAISGLDRFIATTETAKHRIFQFVDIDVMPDNMVIAIASASASVLGVLSSKVHVVWSLAAGGRLGVGNDPRYQNLKCFEPFPMPIADSKAKNRIGGLAERLDAHRRQHQSQFPKLTLTGMYNVLEKLRSEESLNEKEQAIHEHGLVSVLKQIHDDLDAAVLDAYGWPHDLEDEAILQRLVDLNHERSDEESRGLIRWLRPEFQNPDGATQTAFDNESTKKKAKKATAKIKKQPWPKSLPDRMVAIQNALQRHGMPADVKQVAAYYTRANKDNVAELLETLAAVGNVRQIEDGRYVSMQAKAG